VNERIIKKYKSGLADEIEPAISELIERAEQGLVSLERKEALLQTKVTDYKPFFGSCTC
jgi:DASH complex subunit SPC19